MTLLSILLMALPFSHPASGAAANMAGAVHPLPQESRFDADTALLGHVIVPAREFLRKLQVSKPQPKPWHPAGPSPAILAPGLAGLRLTALSGPSFHQTTAPYPRASAGSANRVRAPPFPLFTC